MNRIDSIYVVVESTINEGLKRKPMRSSWTRIDRQARANNEGGVGQARRDGMSNRRNIYGASALLAT